MSLFQVPWGLVCAEVVDVTQHGYRRGCHHDAVIIALYMYIPISLTRLLFYVFQKVDGANPFKVSCYFTYPYKRSMMQEVTQANGIVRICFYTCENRVFFYLFSSGVCNNSTFGVSILSNCILHEIPLQKPVAT